MSDETVKRYEAWDVRGMVDCGMLRPTTEMVRASDYDALRDSHEGLKRLLTNIRAALGIGPGTDVVRAAERARADRERLDWLDDAIRKDHCDISRNGVGNVRIGRHRNDTGTPEEYGTLRDAIAAARRAEGEKA